MSIANQAITVVRDDSLRAPSRETLLEMLKLLFTVSTQQFSEERQSEERIATLVREFLLMTNINSAIDGSSLAEQFSDSAIPENPCAVDAHLSRLAESVV